MGIEIKYYALKFFLNFSRVVFQLPKYNLVSLKTCSCSNKHTICSATVRVGNMTYAESALVLPTYLPKVPCGLLENVLFVYILHLDMVLKLEYKYHEGFIYTLSTYLLRFLSNAKL